MSLAVNRGNGDEEAVTRIQSQSLRRQERGTSLRDGHALAIEILRHRARCYDEVVVRVRLCRATKTHPYTLRRIAGCREILRSIRRTRQARGGSSHYLCDARGIAGSDERVQVTRSMLVRGREVLAACGYICWRRTRERPAAAVIHRRGR